MVMRFSGESFRLAIYPPVASLGTSVIIVGGRMTVAIAKGKSGELWWVLVL
jgi:hypothetical protein